MPALKKSYYIIFSDSLNDRNDRIIFSTRTSASFIIEQAVYENLEQNNFEALDSKIVDKFIQSSILIPYDETELINIVQENKEALSNDNLMYEVIQPSAMCQLGCDYCGQEHKKINLDPSLYKKYLTDLEQRQTEKNIPNFI